MLGRLGGGGLGSLISGWGTAIRAGIGEVVSIFQREGIRGGLSEILQGRREVFQGVQRRGALDALANTKRPGPNLYVSTDLQLSKAMKADFDVSYVKPGETEAKIFRRSMLFDRDRTKRAIVDEFESRLRKDIATAAPESGVSRINVLSVDFVGLEQRSDVDYEWEPDDEPWE